MEILRTQIKQVTKPQIYLAFLETLCGVRPANKIEVVLDNPLALGGWQRQLDIDEVQDYQLRLCVDKETTSFIVPLLFVEQLQIAYDVRDGFLYHMTNLERIQEIRNWVAMWRFCTYCAQYGFGEVQRPRGFVLRKQGEIHELVMFRNITNSLGKENWWVVLRNEKQKFGLRLPTPDWQQERRTAFVTQHLLEGLLQRLSKEFVVECLDD